MVSIETAYSRVAAGERIHQRRLLLGLTQSEISEQINRVPKYYADIEHGTCGMSIETLISISKCLGLSLDYIIYGDPDEYDA